MAAAAASPRVRLPKLLAPYRLDEMRLRSYRTTVLPANWKVVVDGTPILGGIDEKHRNPPDAETKATLYVKATSILGGIEIQD